MEPGVKHLLRYNLRSLQRDEPETHTETETDQCIRTKITLTYIHVTNIYVN